MIRNINLTRDGQKLFGKVFIPEGTGPFPAIIIGHGFGGSLRTTQGYAQAFADAGIAACVFDFIGGGYHIMSDGRMTEMSVLTEAADMNLVFDDLKDFEEIDANRMFLMGCSQGGFVATYVAAHRADEVKGLVAFYPAYVLQDDAKKRTNHGANIKDRNVIMGMTIGRRYDEDALSFDIYHVMKQYQGPALFIHGTADSIVPIAYSQRAAYLLNDAVLIKLKDAGHGFHGKDEQKAASAAIAFVKSLC